MPPLSSIPSLSAILFGAIGLALVALSLRALMARRKPASPGSDLHKELENLLSEIGRGLRALSAPARAGGMNHRVRQEEVGRQLAEMQRRLRLLDEPGRLRYEARAGQVLVDAARAGITLPPWETPMITGLPSR